MKKLLQTIAGFYQNENLIVCKQSCTELKNIFKVYIHLSRIYGIWTHITLLFYFSLNQLISDMTQNTLFNNGNLFLCKIFL